jgi:hypothetical protein
MFIPISDPDLDLTGSRILIRKTDTNSCILHSIADVLKWWNLIINVLKDDGGGCGVSIFVHN